MRSLKTMLRECTWGRSERRRAKETRTPVATLTSVDVLESRIVLAGTPMVAGTPTVIDTPTTIDTPSVTLRNLDHDGAASAEIEYPPLVLTDQLVTEYLHTGKFNVSAEASSQKHSELRLALESAESPAVTVSDADATYDSAICYVGGWSAPKDQFANSFRSAPENTAAPILLPVIRTGSGEQALVVRNDASASASKHVDFLWAPRRVFDQARQTSIVVEMAPINDTIDEGEKDLFFARLGDPSASIGTATALGR